MDEYTRDDAVDDALARLARHCAVSERYTYGEQVSDEETIATALATLRSALAAHESGEPARGSRLWRCEQELAKSRTALAAAEGALRCENAVRVGTERAAEILRARAEDAERALAASRAEVGRLTGERDVCLAALYEIARPGVGPELHDTDEERADHWAAACETERETARTALRALDDGKEPTR